MKMNRGVTLGLAGLVVAVAVAMGGYVSWSPDLDVAPQFPIGPMVGHVTDTTATLWAYGGPNARFHITLQSVEGDPDESRTIDMPSRQEDHHAMKVTLTGLRPDTTYRYSISLGGQVDPRLAGQFATAPAPAEPARFKIAVASCMKPHRNNSSFYLLMAERPAFLILLGDSVYADTTDHETIWAAHLRQRRVPEFAAALRHIPTYATWDDHDFADDASDRTSPGKTDSLRAFKQIWANPSAGTPDVPGVFFRFNWADVDFFVLDGRYHRTPNNAPNDDDKRMLGDGQFQWLADSLIASQATFKVIAQGSALTLDEVDGWLTFDFARRRIYKTIATHRISGVLWLSGDLHESLVKVHPRSATGFYDLYEIISSGIANSKIPSFATLEFDTTLLDPSVRIVIIHGDATVRHDQTVRLSELQID